MIKRFAKKLGLHKNKFAVKIYEKFMQVIYQIPNEDGVICQIDFGLKIKNWNPTMGGMARSIYLAHTFEPTVTKFFKDRIREGMTLVDVGSDNGYYTIIFSKLTGERGKVISFEPIKWAYERTLENVELNNQVNVKVNNLALSDENGSAFIVDPGNDSRLSTSIDKDSSGDKMEVKLEKFDDYIIRNSESKIDMVKIDCEGAEMKILSGMANSIKKFSPDFVIEIHKEKLKIFNNSEKDVFDFMTAKGYNHTIINQVDGGLEEYHVHFYK